MTTTLIKINGIVSAQKTLNRQCLGQEFTAEQQ